MRLGPVLGLSSGASHEEGFREFSPREQTTVSNAGSPTTVVEPVIWVEATVSGRWEIVER